jgi:hypothetical protein
VLVYIRSIDALDRGLVRTLGVPSLRLTHREQRLCSLYDVIVGKWDSAYQQLWVSDRIVTVIPCKQRYTLQLPAVTANVEYICFGS